MINLIVKSNNFEINKNSEEPNNENNNIEVYKSSSDESNYLNDLENENKLILFENISIYLIFLK